MDDLTDRGNDCRRVFDRKLQIGETAITEFELPDNETRLKFRWLRRGLLSGIHTMQRQREGLAVADAMARKDVR